MPQKNIDSLCSRIYRETSAFFVPMHAEPWYRGFEILCGPPHRNAPLLFIAHQPDQPFKASARKSRSQAEQEWPRVNEYATGPSLLARVMRRMFGTGILEKAVGVNAIFARAATIRAYRESVPDAVQEKIRQFCLPRVTEIVNAIQPRAVVFIGFHALTLFSSDKPIDLLRNKHGRVLIRKPLVNGWNSVAILHLTGTRFSVEDRNAIAAYIGELLA